ncbi:MAG: hypothetical protein M0P44_03390 [Clostridiales bacterium]|jgi:hypothetical protein|nr:hypothetical protein [Clostridiales bacterium]MDD2297314.1 hypothetical protein [Sphaerochaetaceae bacterium]
MRKQREQAILLALFIIHNLQVNLENGNQVVYNKLGDEHLTHQGSLNSYVKRITYPCQNWPGTSGSSDITYIKNYTWMNDNNVPSAKMSTLNVAVLYMRSLPEGTRKILAIKKDIRTSNSETLASYYCRIYGHLMEDISIWEIDNDAKIFVV